MKETKYGKYIVKELYNPRKEAPWRAPQSDAKQGGGGRVLYLDDDIVKGAFYLECVWLLPGSYFDNPVGMEDRSHTHDYNEVIAFFGTAPEKPYELNAEAEIWLEDEKHIINSSCFVFVPKGMKHCPPKFTRLDKPVFHFTVGTGRTYF